MPRRKSGMFALSENKCIALKRKFGLDSPNRYCHLMEAKMRSFLLLMVVSFSLGGCAFGNTHRYDLGNAIFRLESDKTVAVTVLDLRPYVLSGDEPPDFVGVTRGGFGNPFNVATSSTRPLADDMTTSIVASLKRANIQAFGVPVPPKTGVNKAREVLLSAEAERFTLMSIREWKTDTYLNTDLIYDVSVNVLGRNGTEIAGKTIQGHEQLGRSGVPAETRNHAERAVRQKLETIFNDPDMASALK